MMIQPISYYDQKRKRPMRYGMPDPKTREPNGRESRSLRLEFLVYFVKIEGNPLLKIGRTQNIVERIKGYEDSSGRIARCVAQFFVPDRQSSVLLENYVVSFLTQRYGRKRREWFLVPDSDLARLVTEIGQSSPVTIVRQSGNPGAPDVIAHTLADEASREARSIAKQYGKKRGRVRVYR